MTLDEKIGQMTQVDRRAIDDRVKDIARYGLGSFLSGGGSTPTPNDPEAWADMYDRYQQQALSTRLGIPLIYGIDAVHGHNNVKGATIFPHNIGMGATRNTELMERVGRATAEEVIATGLNWTFSPCIAVARDERWGRTYESFGEDPTLVAEMGAAVIRGYQSARLDDYRIIATAKHYLGDGGTAYGTGVNGGIDQGDMQVDEETLRSIHLTPYIAAVNVGVGSVMASYSSWNGQKMHGNRYLLTEVLKGELGFQGFVVSDWQAIDQLPGDYRSDVKTAINAGIDMVMVPYEYITFIETLRDLVESGQVPMERIDDAVRRILTAKFELGLFEHPYASRDFFDRVGSAEHRELARQAVRESLVLLKNAGNLLPLPKNLSRIVVTGRNANDIGNQCGGWTITWQGRSGRITTGTTILEAIQNAVSPGTTVIYSRDGSGAEGADVGIAVIGETPYAEFEGDSDNLRLAPADVNAIENLRAAGVPVVVIIVSGRPLIIEPELAKWDAVVAAWLPGTEGQGVADVLFGDYAPTGKLPCSWPRSVDPIPINVDDAEYDPLFPYGFGLHYSD
jgi:beta-glucosidase